MDLNPMPNRACVICTQLIPLARPSHTWTCGEDCDEALKERQRKEAAIARKIADAERATLEDLTPTSEADQARAYLEQQDNMPPPAEAPIADGVRHDLCLARALLDVSLIEGLRPEDSATVAELAAGYIARVLKNIDGEAG